MPHHEFPFMQPEGSEADMFIQWKGTNVCLDFHCPCGTSGHYDGGFAYFIHCPTCDTVFEMGTQVIAKRRPDLGPDGPSVQTFELDIDWGAPAPVVPER